MSASKYSKPCEGELHAFDFSTAKPIRVCFADGIISRIETISKAPPEEQWIAPGLFDLQVNGYARIDFQKDGLDADSLLLATRGLQKAGCTRFLIALITDEWDIMMSRLSHLRSLRESSVELKQAIVGWHIEGPFLSTEPGYHGAHDPACMLDPTPSHIQQLREITQKDPVLLTLAPERRGSINAIRLAAASGITVSLGHTDASAEIIAEACDAGARAFTHLGNGIPRLLDRHDNVLWRVFESRGLTISLIPDRIHVSPPLFRIIHRLLGPERIYYTTDAMSAAGAPPGRYTIGKLELDVGPDQIVRQPGKPLFAGSALRPVDGVFRAAEMLGCGWQSVWDGWSTRPAQLLGLRNELAVGQPATFCILKPSQQDQCWNLRLCVNGQFINAA
jgi:N-acetylglucosamine-6-phosphate deacetylase